MIGVPEQIPTTTALVGPANRFWAPIRLLAECRSNVNVLAEATEPCR